MTNTTLPLSTLQKLWKLNKETGDWGLQKICYEDPEGYLLVYQSMYTKDSFQLSASKPVK
jgi:hypothetical protein